jgi:metal-responsive CopG/Arc/MetJ family transcriptional regulator
MSADTQNESRMIHMRLDRDLLKRIDDYRFKYRFESRSDAFRWLMQAALDHKLSPQGRKRGGDA